MSAVPQFILVFLRNVSNAKRGQQQWSLELEIRTAGKTHNTPALLPSTLKLLGNDFAHIMSLSVLGAVSGNTSFISSEPCWAKTGSFTLGRR